MTNPTLEDNVTRNAEALVMQPEWVEGGEIWGIFPVFTIQSGDRFRATLGCLKDHAHCDVTIKLDYWADLEARQSLASWTEKHDGSVTVVDIDLSQLAGRSVAFVLGVKANGLPDDDLAAWVRPGIWR
jgi:hypothetical protein